MIRSVTVTNPRGESLKMELRRPELSGYVIYRIEGLGPPPATINTTDLATGDGSIYNSAHIQARNILIYIKNLFMPTIEETRIGLYKYFPIKKKIKLTIETDIKSVEIYGYVEKNEPEIFSSQQTVQISILCPAPALLSPIAESVGFLGILPWFEFPFSNESLFDNLLEFGRISIDRYISVPYKGDIDNGVLITIHMLDEVKNLIIFNSETYGSISFNDTQIINLTGSGLNQGDVIEMSTIRGNRYVKLLRGGVYTNIISAIGVNTDWFQLTQGDNVFEFNVSTNMEDVMIIFTYHNAYGGM